jgi:formylglycine-generating enzyme required for sulfatase activity
VETIPGTDVSFEMVWIEPGGFWMGRQEVTWDEYILYCDFDEVDRPPEGVDAIARPSKPLETFPYDREFGMGRRPAVGMSWNAAKKYCQWLNGKTGRDYRLPTDAEWTLALGDQSFEPVEEYAWTADNSPDMTQEVGGKKPNAFGLHDQLGNLWEYTADPYDAAAPEWALLRGGSWLEPSAEVGPDARLLFDEFWNLADPNDPPGTWWVPEGIHLGFRLLRPGPD